MQHVVQARAGTGGDTKLAGQVLKKAADEELSTRAAPRGAVYITPFFIDITAPT